MASNAYTDSGLLYLKAFNPYVDGVIGTDIKLSLKQRIKILFCKGMSVCIGNVFKKNNQEEG